ncbi:MAG TPA: LamG-like jellyroll fold domain-containing protein [Thermoanaerobaculia bacterium]|jgi:hypothetical protein|nr:LamG-like jellyroll fold domain-containing protein [Thermoanaerobaculia bacterium]
MFVFAVFMAGWLGLAGSASPAGPGSEQKQSVRTEAVPAGVICVGAPQGLIAWWTFDEIKGMTSRDLATAQHGKHVGNPVPVSGVVDGALSFDGSHDFVEVPHSSLLNLGSGDFSIDAWVRTKRVAGVQVIVDKREIFGTEAIGYHFFLYRGRPGLQLGNGTGKFHNYISHTSVADGQYHHVAVTVKRESFGPFGAIFYVDGTEVASFNVNADRGPLDTFAPLRVGALSGTPSSFFDGAIDEVEIFNRALRRREVEDIARAGNAGKCKCAALGCTPVAWWPFDEPEGAKKAADIAGHFTGPHEAALTGTTMVTGMVGGALSFNGTSDFASVQNGGPLDVDLSQGSGYTVDTWIRTDQKGFSPLISSIAAPADAPVGYSFFLNEGVLSFQVDNLDGTCTVPACSDLNDGLWHLVGATVTHDAAGKNTVIRLYVDGQLAQVFPPLDALGGGGGHFTGNFAIGYYPPVGRGGEPSFYRGLMDELEIFDHALTETDFSAIYTAGGGGKCKPAARPGICGLSGATPCPAGQFCDFLLAANCRVGPVGGFCRNKPEVCTFDEIPVCGCDGKTYSNDCAANSIGIAVAHPGPCN